MNIIWTSCCPLKSKDIISQECELNKLSSTYSEKIKELRSTAQEMQAAIKIQDKLNELRSKDVVISSYRWIWELIQNAKDCTNSSGKVDIEIVFDSAQKIVEFKHNGGLFATKNIVYLIEQVSTKERSRDSANTGKFGTGFLTTNLLSPFVTISGLLHDEDESNIAKFQVTIDRSGDSLDALKDAIKSSCDQLEASTVNISDTMDENAMNTTFSYYLDESGINVAKVGLENFLITAPYVFAFVSELNKITVTVDGTVTIYTRDKVGTTQSDNTFVSRIKKNGSLDTINIFTIQDDTLMLAAEVKQYNHENHIVPYSVNLPRLFCDFPLLGTHDFTFPVVINSRGFDPTEPRNGIFLYGSNGEQNKKILKDACSLYASMIQYFILNGYKDIYNIVCLPPIESKDWIDKEWYVNEIIDVLKGEIKEFPIFHMLDSSIKALVNEWGIEDSIFLSSDEKKELRDEVWELSSELFPDKHICKNEIEEWYSSLWEDCRNYGLIDLIQHVEKIGNLSKLQEIIQNPIKWLNTLYKLIYEKCADNADISKRDNKIFPNQHGDFCCIKALKADDGIDEAYKEAALLIDIDLKAELVDSRILYKNLEIMSFTDVAYRLTSKAQEHNTNSNQFYKRIIGFIKGNNPKQVDFISLYNIMYPMNPIVPLCVHFIYERLLKDAIEYWCNIICNEINRYNELTDLTTSCSFASQDDAEKWISNYVAYLITIEKSELLDKYSVIPNQNGVLCYKSNLYKENDTIPEFMKVICQVADYDIKAELASNSIEVSKVIPRKKGFKDISEVITNYVRKHMNNISVEKDDDKEAFKQTYKWLREKKDDPYIKQHFSELLEHLYWFYNDDEISESIAKASELDNILSKYGLSDVSQLEKLLIHKTSEHYSTLPIEEILARYGISTKEELVRLIDSHVLGEEFLHNSEASLEKFEYVQGIIQRAINNIKRHLVKIGYNLDDSAKIHKTIFTATINEREIYIIARPSDYDEVILYYDAEFETLDYTKDFELWIDNGKSVPEKLTFGKILKLTGVNKIPLRRIGK